MKKKYIFIAFLSFFLIGIVPPLLVSNGVPFSHAASAFSLGLTILGQLFASFVLHYFCIKFVLSSPHTQKHVIALLSCGTICFGLLMLIYAAIESLCFFFPHIFAAKQFAIFSGSAFLWVLFIISLATGAVYEEVVYREFLPELVLFFTDAAHSWHWLRPAVELGAVLVFAFSHRYLGLPAVINAALSGAVLRYCFCKTGTIYTGCTIHFLYNVLLIMFSLLA